MSAAVGEPIAVGVVIPTRRRAALLAEALESVLAQTTLPVDVVVVHDDAEVPADAVATDGVRHLCTGGQRGASAARNLGAGAVQGSHIAFLDDDDRWKPTYLARVAEALGRSGAAVAFTRVEAITDGRRQPGPPIPPELNVDVALNRVIGITGSSIVAARGTVDVVGGFDPALRAANDLDFVVRVLASGAAYVIVPDMLVEHRHHRGERLTTSPDRRQDLEAFRTKWAEQLGRAGRRRLEADVVSSLRRASVGRLDRARLTVREVRLIGLRAAAVRWRDRRHDRLRSSGRF